MKYYIGIDLGGTNIVAGVVDEQYNILAKASTKTNCPRPDREIARDMAKMAIQAVENAKLTMEQIEWIGIGTPGIANSRDGIIEYSNNLGFVNTPMVKYIQEDIDKPVFVENDANAAAYGEFVAGAAKGANNAVCITLGTGVGGGIIIDGKIYAGSNFAGAEIGHTVISVDGPQCTCGRKGCFEVFSSATGLIRMTKESMAKIRTAACTSWWQSGAARYPHGSPLTQCAWGTLLQRQWWTTTSSIWRQASPTPSTPSSRISSASAAASATKGTPCCCR